MSGASSVSAQSSTASRMRQFGLYRTIDARTEEFLRLSRKRQIRQGCACAAASTAITVTVVVVVFCVYEFSLNSETNLENTLKSKWFSLINDTSENSSFESKINQANIDQTTLKLLPLLIKAIKKNSYLEKLLEDHSNASYHDKRETIEDVEKPAIPTNWFKFPSTKLYAIEYKTSPVVYYKHPTHNIEYYTKIRKIRDYQRVFNYIDKMISEKVYIGATRPIMKGAIFTEKPKSIKETVKKSPPKTTASKSKKKSTAAGVTVVDQLDKITNSGCKCPTNFGILLNKIYSSIQKLLPESTTKIPKRPKLFVMAKNKKAKSIIDKHKALNKAKSDKNCKKMQQSTNEKSTHAQYVQKGPGTEPIKTWQSSFPFEQVTNANLYYNNIPQFIYSDAKVDSSEITTQPVNYIDGTITENDVLKTTQSMQFVNNYENINHRKNLLRNRYPSENTENDIFDILRPGNSGSTLIPNELQMLVEHQLNLIKKKLNNINNEFKNSHVSLGNNTSTREKVFPKAVKNAKIKAIPKETLKNKAATYYEEIKPMLYKIAKNSLRNIVIDDKLLLDYIKTKLDDSNEINESKTHNRSNNHSTEYQNNNESIDPSPTRENQSEIKNNVLIKSDLKDFLNKNFRKSNESDNIPKLEMSNNTKALHRDQFANKNDSNNSIYHLIGSEIEHISNKSAGLNSFEDEVMGAGHNMKLIKKASESAKAKTHTINKNNMESFEEELTSDFVEQTKPPMWIQQNGYEMPKNNSYKEDDLKAIWEDLSNENIVTWKSMLPQHRPTYLEIHRTEARNNDPADDEYNINLNFYDTND